MGKKKSKIIKNDDTDNIDIKDTTPTSDSESTNIEVVEVKRDSEVDIKKSEKPTDKVNVNKTAIHNSQNYVVSVILNKAGRLVHTKIYPYRSILVSENEKTSNLLNLIERGILDIR